MGDIKKIFLIGYVILIFAIAINILASLIGLSNWFIFFEYLFNEGILDAFREVGIISALYLIFIYPVILGFVIYMASKLGLKV